jgi:hypothetical protein
LKSRKSPWMGFAAFCPIDCVARRNKSYLVHPLQPM